MRINQHLKLTKQFLGFKGNPLVHKLLDGGLPLKYQPQYHKLTHNPEFINIIIYSNLGEEGALEAWLHLLADWGFFKDYHL
jgi:hypothetical protein